VDFSPAMIALAGNGITELEFQVADAAAVSTGRSLITSFWLTW